MKKLATENAILQRKRRFNIKKRLPNRVRLPAAKLPRENPNRHAIHPGLSAEIVLPPDRKIRSIFRLPREKDNAGANREKREKR